MLDDILCQILCVHDRACEHGRSCVLARTDNTRYPERYSVVIEIAETRIRVSEVVVKSRCLIIAVAVGIEDYPVLCIADILIRPLGLSLIFKDCAVYCSVHYLTDIFLGFKSEGIERNVVKLVVFVKNERDLVIAVRH